MLGHPLDGDNISSHLFYVLAKENKELCSAKVMIAPTVLFEQGFAKACFSTEKGKKGEKGEVKRKNGKDFDLEFIYQTMTRGCQENQVCASFIQLTQNQDQLNPVRYFHPESLKKFLFQEIEKPKGLLQQFVRPKGHNNMMIQAVWSPMLVLTDCRRNRHSLYDKHMPIWERSATFETHESETTQVQVAPAVTQLISKMCATIVKHFQEVEHVQLSRIVLFCKIDEENQLRLLFTSSLRIADKSGMGNDPITLDVGIKVHELLQKEHLLQDVFAFEEASTKLQHLKIPIKSLNSSFGIVSPIKGQLRPPSRLLPPAATHGPPAKTHLRAYTPILGTKEKVVREFRFRSPARSAATVPRGRSLEQLEANRLNITLKDRKPLFEMSPSPVLHKERPRPATRNGPVISPRGNKNVNNTNIASTSANIKKSELPRPQSQPDSLLRYSEKLPNSLDNYKLSAERIQMGLDGKAIDEDWKEFINAQNSAVMALRAKVRSNQDNVLVTKEVCNAKQRRHYYLDSQQGVIRKESVVEDQFGLLNYNRRPSQIQLETRDRYLAEAEQRLGTPLHAAHTTTFVEHVEVEDDKNVSKDVVDSQVNRTIPAQLDLSQFDIDYIEAQRPKSDVSPQWNYPTTDLPPNLFLPAFMTGGVSGKTLPTSDGRRRGSVASVGRVRASEFSRIGVSLAKQERKPRKSIVEIMPDDNATRKQSVNASTPFEQQKVKAEDVTKPFSSVDQSAPMKMQSMIESNKTHSLLSQREVSAIPFVSPGRSCTVDTVFENWAELNLEEMDLIETQTDQVLVDFDAYLNELVYAIFSAFLVNQGNSIYVEIPEKFSRYISVDTLCIVMRNLHGISVPIEEFFGDSITVPKKSATYYEILDRRRAEALSLLSAEELSRWPTSEIVNYESDPPPKCMIVPRIEASYLVTKGESMVVSNTLHPYMIKPNGLLYHTTKTRIYLERIQEIDAERLRLREQWEKEQANALPDTLDVTINNLNSTQTTSNIVITSPNPATLEKPLSVSPRRAVVCPKCGECRMCCVCEASHRASVSPSPT